MSLFDRENEEKKLKALQNETKEVLEYTNKYWDKYDEKVRDTLENVIEELGKQKLEAGAGILKDIYLLLTMINGLDLSNSLNVRQEGVNNFDNQLKEIETVTQSAFNDMKNYDKNIRLLWGLEGKDGKGITTFIMPGTNYISRPISGPNEDNNWVKNILLRMGSPKDFARTISDSDIELIAGIGIRRNLKEELKTAELRLDEAKQQRKEVCGLVDGQIDERKTSMWKIREGVEKLISLIKEEEQFLTNGKERMVALLKTHSNRKEFSVQEKEDVGGIIYHALRLKELIDEPLLTREGTLTKQVVEMTGLE